MYIVDLSAGNVCVNAVFSELANWALHKSSQIQQVIESDEALDDEVPDSPGVEKQDKEKENKDSKKLRCELKIFH